MGCGFSVAKSKSKRSDTTFDSSYVAITPPTRGISKRLWVGHISEASSSGVSSAYSSTPVRNTKILRNRHTRRQLRPDTPIRKPAQPDFERDATYQNLPEFLKAVPLDIEGYEADFEEQRLERQKQITALQEAFNDTAGYYSEGSSDYSSPLANTFVCTQSGNTVDVESFNDSLNCDLDMEMRMISKACGIMPKTSSPLSPRRNETFEVPQVPPREIVSTNPPSASYQKWQKYLQTTPTHALHNITRIPEAIAGHFCPTDFPAFTDVKALEAAAATKRYQEPSYHEICRSPALPALNRKLPIVIQCSDL